MRECLFAFWLDFHALCRRVFALNKDTVPHVVLFLTNMLSEKLSSPMKLELFMSFYTYRCETLQLPTPQTSTPNKG